MIANFLYVFVLFTVLFGTTAVYAEHTSPVYFQEPEIISVEQGFGTITATVKINENAFAMVPTIVKGQYIPSIYLEFCLC